MIVVAHPTAPGTRILLVDDEESLRLTLAANLELEGFEVVEAASAEEALSMIDAQRFDLVLSDVRMPGVGGIELLRTLQKSRPDLPVVLMTAFTTEDSITRAIESGVFTVLHKPFDPYRQAATLRRAVRRPTVLVVDDCQKSAQAIAVALSERGIRAEAVSEGAQAIDAVRSRDVDVCVTDLVMPDMDGLEVCRELRALDPAISIIVCAATRAADRDDDALMQGAAALEDARYLRKPINEVELVRAIASVRSEVC